MRTGVLTMNLDGAAVELLKAAGIAVTSGGGILGLLKWRERKRAQEERKKRVDSSEEAQVRIKLIDDGGEVRELLVQRVAKLEAANELLQQRVYAEAERAHAAERRVEALTTENSTLRVRLERKDQANQALTTQIVLLGKVPVTYTAPTPSSPTDTATTPAPTKIDIPPPPGGSR